MVTSSDDMPVSAINHITLTVIIINNCYVYNLAVSHQITRELATASRPAKCSAPLSGSGAPWVGRSILTVYTVAEFSKRARTENAFVTRVLRQPKLWVIGSEDKLPVAHGGAPSSRTGSRSDDHVGS